jgi:PAS domain S-box-containing protein/putative nucleotidyltransferase with HDIG domain
MIKELRVLLVEDSDDDCELIKIALTKGGYEVASERVDNAKDMTAALDRDDYDIVLSDHQMPNFNSREALLLLREHDAELPLILVSGKIGETGAVELLKAGASDYISKSHLVLLPAAVERALFEREIISERKKAEEEIKHLASFPILNPISIFEFNMKEEVVFANPAAESMIKKRGIKSPREFLPRNWYQMFVTDDGQQKDILGLEKSLGERVFQENISFLPDSNLLRIYIQDITEQRHAEAALRDSETRYRTIVENLNDALHVIDLKGNILDVNDNACLQLGYTRDEMIGKNILDIDSFDSAQELQRKLLRIETEGAAVFESAEVRKDGSFLPVEVSAKLISSKGKGIIQAFVRDISERKKAEEEQAKSVKKLEQTLKGTVNAITAISSMRDPYTSGHEVRVAELVVAIGKELGLTKDEVDELRMIAILHDIGKVYVPSEILSKPGRLTDIEFDLIKTHSRVGYNIVKEAALPCNVAETILQHHERSDGSGYPDGIKKDKINIGARILGVADVVEAMSSHRPYRAALGIDKALEEISANKNILYDPEVVDACVKLFRDKGFEF